MPILVVKTVARTPDPDASVEIVRFDKGHVVAVVPDTWEFGTREINRDDLMLVKVPGRISDFNKYMTDPGELSRGGPKEPGAPVGAPIVPREFKFDVDMIMAKSSEMTTQKTGKLRVINAVELGKAELAVEQEAVPFIIEQPKGGV